MMRFPLRFARPRHSIYLTGGSRGGCSTIHRSVSSSCKTTSSSTDNAAETGAKTAEGQSIQPKIAFVGNPEDASIVQLWDTAIQELERSSRSNIAEILRTDLEMHKTADEFPPQFLESEANILVVSPFTGGSADDSLSVVQKMGSNLQWVHTFSTGIDLLKDVDQRLSTNSPQDDTSLLNDENSSILQSIPITNARSASSANLAEFGLASMLYFTKRIPLLQQQQKNSRWSTFLSGQLRNKKLGLLGNGSIAQELARVVAPFDMEISSLGRRDFSDDKLYEMFRTCDYIFCSLPGTPETYQIIDRSCFQQMKENLVFINVGRGSVVNELDLIHYVGAFGGLALDVFNREPLYETSWWWKIAKENDHVLLSPHCADYTEDWIEVGVGIFADRLEEFITNKPFSDGIVCIQKGY